LVEGMGHVSKIHLCHFYLLGDSQRQCPVA
jgi:hypothetical protein